MFIAAQREVTHALDHAGKRLGQSCISKGGRCLQSEQVLFHNASGNDDRFGVSTVQKQQVVTQILSAMFAIVALPAWRRVRGHNSFTNRPSSRLWMDFADRSR